MKNNEIVKALRELSEADKDGRLTECLPEKSSSTELGA
mgnify:CR=1 FL=1